MHMIIAAIAALMLAEIHVIEPTIISPSNIMPQEVEVPGYASETIKPDSIPAQVTEDIFVDLEDDKIQKLFESSYYSTEKQSDAQKLRDLVALDRQDRKLWIKALLENKESRYANVIKGKPFRCIAEAWLENGKYMTEDQAVLQKNLKILKRLGYDSVLVRFDGTEQIDSLMQMADDILAADFSIVATYVGKDMSWPFHWNPYSNSPESIRPVLQQVAKKSIAWFFSWRTTSSHMTLLPKEYFTFISNTVREANPNIMTFGEVYYGRVEYLKKTAISVVNVDCMTGYVINSIGFSGINHAYVANNLFAKYAPDYKKLMKVGQVIGPSPYYLSKKKLKDISVGEEYSIKNDIEKSFESVRCSTVTMLHDGLDDHYTTRFKVTDNILKSTRLISHFENNIDN